MSLGEGSSGRFGNREAAIARVVWNCRIASFCFAVHCATLHAGDAHSRCGIRKQIRAPKKFFFYPAQVYRHKNHRALIEAIALMKDTHSDVRLVLVGAAERNGYKALRALVEAKGLSKYVQFLGYVPDADMPGFTSERERLSCRHSLDRRTFLRSKRSR